MERLSRLGARLRTLGLCCAVAACGTTPRILVLGGNIEPTALATLLAAHPLQPGQNISATLLGHTNALSYHLVQIRDREQPHVHATHDLVVTLLRGSGTLYVDGRPVALQAGDVTVVTHGTPHYFVNTDAAPAVAFVTFAPPYDGADQVPVGR